MTSSIKRKINSSKIVSFDIFDTLLFRSCTPEEVFYAVEIELNLKDFVFKRKQAQSKAFEYMNQNKKGEITLDDIYTFIDLKDDLAIKAKKLEIKKESSVLYRNNEMYAIYDYALKRKKIVIAISDMYLSKKIITKFLREFNFKKFDKVFVSSDYGKTKRGKGELFSTVIEEYNTKNIFHLGDNKQDDYHQAKLSGIKSLHYKKNFLRTLETNNFDFKKVSNIPFGEKSWEFIGYKYGGILYYNYLDWLSKSFIVDNIEKVLFLSRDGYLLQKLYNKQSEKIENEYLYGSRISFSLAMITNNNFNFYIEFLISGYKNLSLHEIFDRISLPYPSRRDYWVCGFKSLNDRIKNEENANNLKKLMFEYKTLILEKSKNSRRSLKSYLEKVIGSHTKIALVDIGWSGTSQYSLNKFIETYFPNVEITGYYLAIFRSKTVLKRKKEMVMKGYLCDLNKNEHYMNVINKYRVLLEILFSAPHNTVIDYTQKETPVFTNKTNFDIILNDINKKINWGICYFFNNNKSIEILPINDLMDLILNLFTTLKDSKKIRKVINFDSWSYTKNRKQTIQSLLGE